MKIDDEVVDNIKRELDNHNIGGLYHASQLMSKMHDAHSKIIKWIEETEDIGLSVSSTMSMKSINGKKDRS